MADTGISYRKAGKRTQKASAAAKTSAEGARADISIEDELWEAAVKLRGNIAPADYKHYVLPLLFLRYISLAYEQRRTQLEDQIHDKKSEYLTNDPKVAAAILADADEYKSMGIFIVPTEARWQYLVQHAQDDDIKLKIDRAMEVLEQKYPELRGVLPKIYAGSNLDRENVTGLINLFAREIFTAIMVNGAAGQDAALSRDERRSLVAEAVAAVGSRTPIIAALRETNEMTLGDLAKDATAAGAHAVLLMPPPDKSDVTSEKARSRCNLVFEATDFPVAIYQVGYSTETLTKLAELPPVFAIKEGSGDPVAFERNLRSVRALGRNIAIWSTNSRWLLADLAVGADGILSGMGSIAADLQVALANAVWRSDLAAARRVNDRLFPLTQVFYTPGGDAHSRMKYALKRIGRWEHNFVRPPLKPLDDAERADIDLALQESGLIAALKPKQ